MTITRRAFLAGAGVVAVGSTTAAAQSVEDWTDDVPEHTSISFERDVLERYQPLLVTNDIDLSNLQGLYGMVARSTEHSTNVCIYACSYATQTGISPFAPPLSDSHYGDHEWVYVFWSDDSGDIEEVTFSAYHWIAGRQFGKATSLYEETHPKLRIIAPWHQYAVTTQDGEFVDLFDLSAAFQGWLDNGMDEHIHLPTVTEPWTMQTRPHWWASTVGSFSMDALYAETLYSLGFFGADQSKIVNL